MDNFSKSEWMGRMVFVFHLGMKGVKRNVLSENRYSHYDGMLTGLSDTTAIYELKYRDIPTSTYEEQGWLLEEKKAKPLLESASVSGFDQALYVVITQEDLIFWDISKLDLNYEIMYCTHTTAENYHKGEIPKSVALLQTKDAICKIKRKDGMRLLLS